MPLSIRQENQSLLVDAPRFTARFDGAALASVRDRATGVEFLHGAPGTFPLKLFYVQRDELGADKHQQVGACLNR
jgi:hypothetical protein